jgi:methionine synthase I (cobalamin-dependent)
MTGKADEGDSVNEINSPLLKKSVGNTGMNCTKGPESRFKRMCNNE